MARVVRDHHLEVLLRVLAAGDVVGEAAAEPHARLGLEVDGDFGLGRSGELHDELVVDLHGLLVFVVLLAEIGDLQHRLRHVGGARRAAHDRLVVLAHDAVGREGEAEHGLLLLDHEVRELIEVLHHLKVRALARIEVEQVLELLQGVVVVFLGRIDLDHAELGARRFGRGRPFAHERVERTARLAECARRLELLGERELLGGRGAVHPVEPALLLLLGALDVVQPVKAGIGVRRVGGIRGERGAGHVPRGIRQRRRARARDK